MSLNSELVAEMVGRRGKLHPFEALVCENTALLVIDMQNGFLEAGSVSEIPAARDIVGNINRLSSTLRELGGRIVYLQHTVDERGLQDWSIFYRHFASAERVERLKNTFAKGSHGHGVFKALQVAPSDLLVEKTRFSPFIDGASSLHTVLKEAGVDTIIITGTVTNICCESTARDAMMLNYKVFAISDAMAAPRREDHDASLAALATIFAEVRDTSDMVALMHAG